MTNVKVPASGPPLSSMPPTAAGSRTIVLAASGITEAETLCRIAELIDPLPPVAQRRVVTWLHDVYAGGNDG